MCRHAYTSLLTQLAAVAPGFVVDKNIISQYKLSDPNW
jgi:hypothetical protein